VRSDSHEIRSLDLVGVHLNPNLYAAPMTRNFESSIDAVAGSGPHSARLPPSVLEINRQRCAKSTKYPLNAQSVAPYAGVVQRRNGTKTVKCPNFCANPGMTPDTPHLEEVRPGNRR
jgi:hypothetical protein